MNKKSLTILAAFIGLISTCWSLFLTYKILVHIQASELMWFVFILYIPITIIAIILLEIVNSFNKK